MLPVHGRKHEGLADLVTAGREVHLASGAALFLKSLSLSAYPFMDQCGEELLGGLRGFLLQQMIVKKLYITRIDLEILPIILSR
jgi:hypothetical protein